MVENQNITSMIITYDMNKHPGAQMSEIMRQVADFAETNEEYYMAKYEEGNKSDEMLALYATIFRHCYINSIVTAAVYEAPTPEYYEKLLKFSHALAGEMKEYMDKLIDEKNSERLA